MTSTRKNDFPYKSTTLIPKACLPKVACHFDDCIPTKDKIVMSTGKTNKVKVPTTISPKLNNLSIGKKSQLLYSLVTLFANYFIVYLPRSLDRTSSPSHIPILAKSIGEKKAVKQINTFRLRKVALLPCHIYNLKQLFHKKENPLPDRPKYQ